MYLSDLGFTLDPFYKVEGVGDCVMKRASLVNVIGWSVYVEWFSPSTLNLNLNASAPDDVVQP